MKYNAKNERVKRRYRIYLKEALGRSEPTIRQIDKAISRYEDFTNKADFGCFDQRLAVRFKEDLVGRDLAKATILSIVTALKRFFSWLSLEPRYKSRIKKSNIEYLNIADKDVRAARAPADRPFPSLEQVKRAISAMPVSTSIELRDRAVIALLALTGIRDGALITLKAKHLDVERKKVLQNPNDVATKNSKRIDTFLLNIAPEVKEILLGWKKYHETDLMLAPNDPLFPSTSIQHGDDLGFVTNGLTRKHWSTAQPVREIVRKAFEAVDLPYCPPHTFRNMLTQQGYKLCKTPEELKIWSQNFGHENIMTTLNSYGKVDLARQAEVIDRLGFDHDERDRPVTMKDLEEILAMKDKR